MTNVIPLGSGLLPQEFHPTATQAKIVVSEARIKFYRGKKMLSELTAAIDGLITEQTMFVAWWDANVGVRSGNPGNAALRSLLSVTAAETMTGITQQTVSRWRKSLQKPDKYRRLLLRDLALIAEANHRAEGTGETQWFTPAQICRGGPCGARRDRSRSGQPPHGAGMDRGYPVFH